MKNPALGFTFRKTISGHFALGETEQRAGKKAGRAAGQLAIHATIPIDDLDKFASHNL